MPSPKGVFSKHVGPVFGAALENLKRLPYPPDKRVDLHEASVDFWNHECDRLSGPEVDLWRPGYEVLGANVQVGAAVSVIRDELHVACNVTVIGKDPNREGGVVPGEVVLAVTARCYPGVVDRLGKGCGSSGCYCGDHDERDPKQLDQDGEAEYPFFEQVSCPILSSFILV